MKRTILAGLAGLIFGVGLVLSGMTRPAKVVAFLDVTGAWDPSLAFVMLGAIAVHLAAYRLAPRLGQPLLGGRFQLPTRRDLDPRLLGGAALFGAGWGLAGVCPGPGLVSLATGAAPAFLFFGGLPWGMVLFQILDRTWLSVAQNKG